MPAMLVLWPFVACVSMAMGAQPAAGTHQAPAAPPASVKPDAAPSAKRPIASSFRLTLDPALHSGPYSGRVYVVLTKSSGGEPRRQMGIWGGSAVVLALDVSNVPPGTPIDVGNTAMAWPRPLAELEPGDYSAQAVARRNLDSPHVGEGAGDLYSDPVTLTLSRDSSAGAAEFKLTHAVPEQPFKETDRVKLVSIVSPSLSAFYGREVKVNAGVVLPEHWKDDPAARYPTVYWIGGFGASHHGASQTARYLAPPPGTPDVIIVVPDPSSHFGHNVFADSANNGPRGKALIEELIPAVEQKYHGAQSGQRRFVSGISSGGWSSLWLQVAYPDQFNGTWSHCPDPVDFRDFQRIDLYTPGANMYRDARGERRPLGRDGENVKFWYDDFVRQEDVLGDGGQIRAFEAVFSPRGRDGRPAPLFDRATGAVNTSTANAWEKYDIRLVLERNWKDLGPKLAGKIHVYAGGMDNFYLDGAAIKLKDSLAKLGSDATVEVVPGMGHTVYMPGVKAMYDSIAQKCK